MIGNQGKQRGELMYSSKSERKLRKCIVDHIWTWYPNVVAITEDSNGDLYAHTNRKTLIALSLKYDIQDWLPGTQIKERPKDV